MDPSMFESAVAMATGAAICVIAYSVGRARGMSVQRQRERNRTTRPECGCGHSIGMHADKAGACNYSRWDSFNEREHECSCVSYDGPMPLPDYYAPPIGE